MKYKRILIISGITCILLLTVNRTVQGKDCRIPEEICLQAKETSRRQQEPDRCGEPSGEQPVELISELYDSLELIPAPEPEITDESGKRYYIKTREIEAVKKTGRKTEACSEILYQSVEKNTEIPGTAEVQITDEASKTTFTAELPLTEAVYENERWENLLSFTVTFHQYGAELYGIGDGEITISDACSEAEAGTKLAAVSSELFQMIGINHQDGQIEGFRWSGASYRDSGGITCRDGEVWGSLRVFDCRAAYQGITALPDIEQYRLRTVYEAEEGTERSTEKKLPSAADPDHESAEEIKPAPGFWGRLMLAVKKYFSLTVGLLFIIPAALGLRFLIRAARRLQRKWRDQDGR